MSLHTASNNFADRENLHLGHMCFSDSGLSIVSG